ncbi:MAG: protein kinase, partial [Polyangiaceae bacterium]|nr:protein kinase [Polyangiaceae bacterium]
MRHEAMIGCKIAGRFTIKRLLGEGGMASVYVAERDAEPRQVALKIMDPVLMTDRSFVKRFQREAKAAARVKHPSSVKIFEYGVDGRLSYIVMELLAGHDLYALLEREGALSQRRAARLLAEVCDPLMVAHDMGIVHRDLKPENIMVIPDPGHPNGERVKVLDFGIAKVLEPDHEEAAAQDPRLEPSSAITRAGTLVGTPAYMSPEQCGLLPVDTRADIYTCGVLLYQIVTGRLPFEGETPLHTATLHIHAPVPAPSAVAPGIDPRLEALILKALAKKPAERHQTARHLGASLRKLAPDLPDVAVGAGVVSKRQTSAGWPREVPPPPPSSPGQDGSMESARTLTSAIPIERAAPPPPVMLHGAPTARAPRTNLAAPPPPARSPYQPMEMPPPDSEGEVSTVTLVRPDRVPSSGPATPRVASRTPTDPPPDSGRREVKSTLRAAADFGVRPPERRPEVRVPVATPVPTFGAPPPPRDPLAQSGGYGTPGPRDPLAQSSGYGTPGPRDPLAQSRGYGAPGPRDPLAQSGGYGAPAPRDPLAQSGGYGAPAPRDPLA